jgi:hypothetical protein
MTGLRAEATLRRALAGENLVGLATWTVVSTRVRARFCRVIANPCLEKPLDMSERRLVGRAALVQ